MKNLLNPKWLFLINTAPILVLIFISIGELSIIQSLLTPENLKLWITFGILLSTILIGNILYAFILIIRNKQIQLIFGVVNLVINILFIYCFNFFSFDLLPNNIPDWMFSHEIILYVGTFLMPTLAYSLLIVVLRLTSNTKKNSIGFNSLLTILIPIIWFCFFQLIAPMWQSLSYKYETHFFVIISIVGVILFLFFLIRSIYILITQKNKNWKKFEPLWKIIFCLILPIVGLIINNDQFDGLFGNFSNEWFYILAIVNGILICLPVQKGIKTNLIIFILRSTCFPFTLYFFLVFLPFLPLSVIAIVLIGTGFLMLSPLVLFLIHISELSKSFNSLNQNISKIKLRLISCISLLIIPLFITLTYNQDKIVLHETLEYIYTPDYSKEYNIKPKSLERTLNVVKKNRNNSDLIFNSQTPYLSGFYKWIVLDNLTLSNSKIEKIEQIFFNKEVVIRANNTRKDKDVKITNIKTSSTYDDKQNIWKSWIDFEITNCSNRILNEYSTQFELPNGCWISDYYLFVNEKKEMGILAEKKAATWLYSQIRNTRKDPGILNYISGNQIQFRVYPFAKQETRKTGIELIHKEPVELNIDEQKIILGNNKPLDNIEINGVNFITASNKKNLEKTKRIPYFHFVVDISEKSDINGNKLFTQIKSFEEEYPNIFNNSKIDFVNSNTKTYNINSNWLNVYKEQTPKAGFYLDRAIKKSLTDSYFKSSNSYPIFIVISNDFNNAILENDYKNYKITYPESDKFYELDSNGTIYSHSFIDEPSKRISKESHIDTSNEVYIYHHDNQKIAYLPINDSSDIVLTKKLFRIENVDEINEKNWQSALIIQANTIHHNLNPYSSKIDWLTSVKSSFKSKIMTPYTAYMVVENEAQKALLMKKQKEVLKGNKSLDLGEDVRRMSEPASIILIIILLFFICYKKRNHISEFIITLKI